MATAERLNIEESKDLVTLEELEGRDITCMAALATINSDGISREGSSQGQSVNDVIPLMILQKIQAAEDMVVVAN